MKRLRNLLILFVCGAFAFGGTFTCKGSHGRAHYHDGDRDHHHHRHK